MGHSVWRFWKHSLAHASHMSTWPQGMHTAAGCLGVGGNGWAWGRVHAGERILRQPKLGAAGQHAWQWEQQRSAAQHSTGAPTAGAPA